MLKITVTIEAKITDDMADALELITNQVRDGFTSGHQRGTEGAYTYAIEGEEEAIDEYDDDDLPDGLAHALDLAGIEIETE